MLKIENTEVFGWEAAIRGMRNPMNSWEKSDSVFVDSEGDWYTISGDLTPFNTVNEFSTDGEQVHIGMNDLGLANRLANNGPVHAKYRRMITVYVDITAPLYWWKEFDTYKVGTVANSCSTMHKIADKEFTLKDFSCEHLINDKSAEVLGLEYLEFVIGGLNKHRNRYLQTKDKKHWWQMIQLLPSSYNQRRTVMLNYEVLANIYKWRKDHKLDEWCVHKTPEEHKFRNKDFTSGKWGFCDWIESLPYSELITGDK